MRFKVIRISISVIGLWATGFAFAQPPAPIQRPAPADPNVISIENVCAAALPRAEEGKRFEWSPTGRTIAYFRPVADNYGLRMELDAVSSDGSDRRTLLTSKAINELFPGTPTGHQGGQVPPPKAAVGFAWSPDGKGLVVYNNLSIFWLDETTHQTKSLVTGKEPISDVQLSPDGSSVAFVRAHNLWAVKATGGAEWAVTKGGTDAVRKGELDWLYGAELGATHGYSWSPDSSRIAYLEFNLTGVASYTPPFQSPEEPPLPTIDYPLPGAKIPEVRAFVVTASGKSAPIAVDTGKEKNVYLPRLQWLPDGKRLAIQRLNRDQAHLDLLLVNAATGSSQILLSETDPYWINLSHILYFLKGAPQFLWSSERSGYRHLYLYGLDRKLVRQLTDGPWEVTALNAVDESAQKVYFTSTQVSPLERHVFVAGFDGHEAKRLTAFSGTHEAAFAPDASQFVDNFSTAIKPWSRTVFKTVSQKSSGLSEKMFALDEQPSGAGPAMRTINFITVPTHDDIKLNAMLIQPAGFPSEKKYPVVIFMRGGPGQQAVRDAWDGDVSMWQQMLAQRGYVVFALDNRGSGGRGHLFEEYVHYRFAAIEMVDQHDGFEFLRSLPYIDSTRMAVWGSGFGGMLTVNGMLHPRLGLKAGFAIAPIVDWFQYDTVFAERYLGSSISNQDGYLTSSPLDRAGALKNPLLVSQGAADLQVHPEQAMELQHELVEAQKHAEISLYPGAGHTIDGHDACVVSYQTATDFFAKNL